MMELFMAMTSVDVNSCVEIKKTFSEYSTDGPSEKLIGIFCK